MRYKLYEFERGFYMLVYLFQSWKKLMFNEPTPRNFWVRQGDEYCSMVGYNRMGFGFKQPWQDWLDFQRMAGETLEGKYFQCYEWQAQRRAEVKAKELAKKA